MSKDHHPSQLLDQIPWHLLFRTSNSKCLGLYRWRGWESVMILLCGSCIFSIPVPTYLAWFVVLFQNRPLMSINIPALNSSPTDPIFFLSAIFPSLSLWILKDVGLNVSVLTFSLSPSLSSTFSWWKRASCSITQLFEEGVTPHKTIENKIPLILLSLHRLLRLFLCLRWQNSLYSRDYLEPAIPQARMMFFTEHRQRLWWMGTAHALCIVNVLLGSEWVHLLLFVHTYLFPPRVTRDFSWYAASMKRIYLFSYPCLNFMSRLLKSDSIPHPFPCALPSTFADFLCFLVVS